MIIPDSKKIASVLVSKMDKKGHSTGGEPVKAEYEMDDDEQGMSSAAEDMIAAMHERSPHAVMKAMRSFIDQHTALVNSPLSQTDQRERQEEEDAGEYEYPEK